MIINTQTNAFVFNYRVYGFIRDKFFTVDETRRDTNFRYVKSRVSRPFLDFANFCLSALRKDWSDRFPLACEQAPGSVGFRAR